MEAGGMTGRIKWKAECLKARKATENMRALVMRYQKELTRLRRILEPTEEEWHAKRLEMRKRLMGP